MGLVAKDTGTTYEPPPAGNHVARCVSLIDIGMQPNEYQGVSKPRLEVIIGWELPNEMMDAEDGQQPQPYRISRFITNTLCDMGNLRPLLESWRGKAFTNAELEGFDLTNIVGKPCMVNVVHKQKVKGGIRAEVTGVTPIPKGLKCPPQVHPTIIFDCDNIDREVYDGFSDGMKKIVDRRIIDAGGGEDNPGGYATEIPKDDDIPFD